MKLKIDQLKDILAEVIDLKRAAALLNWDQQCYMPPEGALERGQQIATLYRLQHIRFTSDEVGRLLDDLKGEVAGLPADSDEGCLIKVTSRLYDHYRRVPPELVSRRHEAVAVAYQAWQEARENSDFAHFQPHLEKLVDITREYAACFAPYEHVYDPLLAIYEPGLKTADVQKIFTTIRPQQVALIKAIAGRPQVDDAMLHQTFDPQKQWGFGVEVATKFGYDWKRGRLDSTAHPFTTTFGLGDVRITTHVYPNHVTSALFSTMHETGHALYEQGPNPALNRTPLTDEHSLALHESQSRLWENLVGRSLPFWQHYYPRLQEYFPSQLGNVSLDVFYKAINKVEPSLVRVEADEATYNLHVMLRLELEIALMEGKLQVKDLPEAWNARMQEYLGIVPPDDAHGVLQDVHWSQAYFGYFSTYALGNLISAQWWELIQRDIPDLEEQIRHAEFTPLLAWLREKIHVHGAKFNAPELVQRVAGSPIDPEPYMRYLKRKYSEIYGF